MSIIPFPASRLHSKIECAVDALWCRRGKERLLKDQVERLQASIRSTGRASGLDESAINRQIADFMGAVAEKYWEREQAELGRPA